MQALTYLGPGSRCACNQHEVRTGKYSKVLLRVAEVLLSGTAIASEKIKSTHHPNIAYSEAWPSDAVSSNLLVFALGNAPAAASMPAAHHWLDWL